MDAARERMNGEARRVGPSAHAVVRSPTSADHRSARRGFTLLEVILVLGLLVVIAAMSWPILDRNLAVQRLRRAADSVRVQMARARNAAITTGQAQAFYYMPAGLEFYFEPYSLLQDSVEYSGTVSFGGTATGAATPTIEMLPYHITFGQGQTFADARSQALTASSTPTATVAGNWAAPILFFADGTATSAEVYLLSDDQRQIPILLRGLTGATSLGEIGLSSSGASM